MKTVTAGMANHLAQITTALALGIKITRGDGQVFGLTDHDRDIILNSDGLGTITYKAGLVAKLSAIDGRTGLGVDNLDMQGIYDATAITEADLRKGKFDYAEVKVFRFNWQNVTDGVIKMQRGWLGEHTRHRSDFMTELRGLLQAYSRVIGELYGPLCRAELGDSRCKVNLVPLTINITVATVLDAQRTFQAVEDLSGYLVGPDLSPWFVGGVLAWVAGANAGDESEIKDFVPGTSRLTLFPSATEPIVAGATAQIVPGCDKRRVTCHDKFSNVINLRGEPDLPGLDITLDYRISPGSN